TALALRAEAIIFELHEHHVGEAIVELRGVDVGRTDTGHAIGRLAALDRGGMHHVFAGEPAREIVEAAEAADENRRGFQIARAFRGSDDHRSCPIAAQRAIEQTEGRYDLPRLEIV